MAWAVSLFIAPSAFASDDSSILVASRGSILEKSPAEYGYGRKTKEEIEKEKLRAPRIGVLGALTGELKKFGNAAANGAELASDELDAKGGINGQEFEFFVFDTGGKMGGARRGIEAFSQRNVLGIVGAATGEVSFSSSKRINDEQIIMVSAGSRRRLGDTGPYNFRITLNDKAGAKGLIDYLKEKKHWKKFALLSTLVNDFSIQLSAVFKEAIFDSGLKVTDELFLWPTSTTNMGASDTSVEAQVKKLKKTSPDALVYTGGAEEAAELVSEMRKQGVTIPIIGGEDLMDDRFLALGDGVVGTIVYSGFNPDSQNPRVRHFVKAYKKRFGKKPSRLAALSYDAFNLLVEAIKRAKSMRPTHLQQAMFIKDFHGVTGKMKITESGEAVKDLFIFQVKKVSGKPEFVAVKDAEF